MDRSANRNTGCKAFRRISADVGALTVRKHRLEGKNPISEADLEWIFARNYEGTE